MWALMWRLYHKYIEHTWLYYRQDGDPLRACRYCGRIEEMESKETEEKQIPEAQVRWLKWYLCNA